MKPSQFTKFPYDSIFQNSESETVARNIMVILSRTGNEFRELSWEEYRSQRLLDGNFSEAEKSYFDKVSGHCTSEESALIFCKNWAAS